MSGITPEELNRGAAFLNDARTAGPPTLGKLIDNAQDRMTRASETIADLQQENDRLCAENERVQREAGRMLREAENKPSPSWSTEWPTREGWYWFYGWRSAIVKGAEDPARLTIAAIAEGSGASWTIDGYHLLRELGATGFWLPLETPTLPEEVPA